MAALCRAGVAASVPGRSSRGGVWSVSDTDITRLLALARAGEPAQLGAVFEALYPELRRLAHSRMHGGDATFTPTVLVHELFLRITQGAPLSVADRDHFFAASARAMRWILVEHARQRATDKRGGGQVMVALDEEIAGTQPALTNVLLLDQGLEALEAISPQRRRIVEMRYFAGMEFAEIARLLDCSDRTVYREWERARAFLQALFHDGPDDDDGDGDGR